MNVSQVATPPAKPLMIFDGDCRFCTLWVKRWQQSSGESVDYLPVQDPVIGLRFPEIPREQFDTAVQLIEANGRVYSGAEAALRVRAKNSGKQWLWRAYQRWPLFGRIAERSYRFIAEHRTIFSKLTRIAYGNHVELPSYFWTRWVFLRALGLIYIIAFASLWTQIDGLIGSNGILPAGQYISQIKEQATAVGIGLDRYRLLPTLSWFNTSDWILHFQCGLGVVLGVLVIAGIAPAPCLFLLWLIYLSLSGICRDFLSFQWDILLLETGFLAIFLAPLQLLPSTSRETPPSRLVIFLFRWLLFRLMFESGCVKLLSGDAMWRNLTALSVHYETQPLPTWFGWYIHQLPLWVQKISCLLMFFSELVVPFFFFAPRRLRFYAAGITALLQVVILLTGNYTFFNYLTLALCLLLLDDFVLARIIPGKISSRFTFHVSEFKSWGWLVAHQVATISLAVIILLTTSLHLIRSRASLMRPVISLNELLSPFRSINSYGLFAVMTPTRPEIVIEGSNDGYHWLAYEFKYKPTNLKRRPAFVAPHQPRLDWQMWFAALGTWRQNPWFVQFIVRLQKGSPEVLDLLRTNPFPKAPPRLIRATLYEYHFTSFAERKRTGQWWRAVPVGEYLPPIATHARDVVPPVSQPAPKQSPSKPPAPTTPKKGSKK